MRAGFQPAILRRQRGLKRFVRPIGGASSAGRPRVSAGYLQDRDAAPLPRETSIAPRFESGTLFLSPPTATDFPVYEAVWRLGTMRNSYGRRVAVNTPGHSGEFLYHAATVSGLSGRANSNSPGRTPVRLRLSDSTGAPQPAQESAISRTARKRTTLLCPANNLPSRRRR